MGTSHLIKHLKVSRAFFNLFFFLMPKCSYLCMQGKQQYRSRKTVLCNEGELEVNSLSNESSF